MSKKLHFIQVVPDDPCFWWQTAVQLYNFSKYGYDKQARVLVFLSSDKIEKGFNDKWDVLIKKFPSTKFFFYPDYNHVTKAIIKANYQPLLRPYCLEHHFRAFPELKDDAIFYHDSDVLFTRELDVEKLLDDNTNYLSYTGRREDEYNYQCFDHFLSKEKNIREDKFDEYIKSDPIKRILSSFGITVEQFIERKSQVGGSQYLLKNIDYRFWQEVFQQCINIRSYLQKVNQHVMKGETSQEREDNGFQSWAADMWAIQFVLWNHGKKTECPPEMDFAWATDTIDRWDKCPIYHDAGPTSNEPNSDGDRLFYKRGTLEKIEGMAALKASYMHEWGSSHLKTPFQEDLSYVSNKYCSSKYVSELKEAQKFLNL